MVPARVWGLPVLVLGLFLAALWHRPMVDESMAPIAEAIGLRPEVLLAAGLSAADGGAIVGRLRLAAEARASLQSAQGGVDLAVQSLAAAESELAAHPDDEAAIAALHDARAQVFAARQSLRDAKAALFAAAMQGVATETVNRVRACRASSNRHVPSAFMAASCQPADWTAIESAVLAEERALQLGEAVPELEAALLSQIRSQATVVQATQALATQLDAMRAALQS